MISKIIALVIAFVFILSAPIYTAIINSSNAVEFGAGDGVSAVIEDPEALQALLAAIPSVDIYKTCASITDLEGYEDFQAFTMVEDGFATNKTRNEYASYYDEEEERYIPAISETAETTSHILEVCFGVNSVYYHCKGEIETVVDYYERTEYDYQNPYIIGERTARTFDIELYYSENTVLVKYNDFYYTDEYRTSNDYYATWQPLVLTEDDKGYEDRVMRDKTVAILDSVWGVWLAPAELPDGFDAEAGPDVDENMTEDQILQIYMDYMVISFCATFTDLWTTEITNSTAINAAYLAALGGYISSNLTTSFTESFGTYSLKDNEEIEYGYIDALFGQDTSSVYQISSASSASDGLVVDFTVGSDEADIFQYIKLNSKNGTGNYITMCTRTTIKNVGNTVVSLKNSDVQTIDEALGDALIELMTDLMSEED